jgi:hypothetical protein
LTYLVDPYEGGTFHFQITAAGLSKIGTDSEAESFKKIPTLEHLQDMPD